MIVSFRHKGLRRFFRDDDASKVPPEMAARIGRLLAALDLAASLADLDRPSFRLHPLKGDLRGYWSISVTANWRLIFRLDDGRVEDVDLVDYH